MHADADDEGHGDSPVTSTSPSKRLCTHMTPPCDNRGRRYCSDLEGAAMHVHGGDLAILIAGAEAQRLTDHNHSGVVGESITASHRQTAKQGTARAAEESFSAGKTQAFDHQNHTMRSCLTAT